MLRILLVLYVVCLVCNVESVRLMSEEKNLWDIEGVEEDSEAYEVDSPIHYTKSF